MHLSNYLENKLIDLLFRGVPYAIPSMYLALCTATLNDAQTGATIPEVISGSYVRQQLFQGIGYWTAPGTDGKTNSQFWNYIWRNSGDAQDWGTVTSIAITDAMVGGNLLWWADLVAPVRLQPYDKMRIPIGKISFQIDS
jgi:hypothetical protein